MQRHNKSAGEYDHKAYHPVKDFLSGLLDMTIIKPLVECVTGKDLITGERLTETEKGWKLIGACIDLFTFGQGALAIKGAGLAGKQALKTIGRTMIVDMLSNTAGYTVAYGCDELGMPMAVTWMLSVFTGCTVSAAAGKYIIKDADRLVKEIAPEDVDDFLKELEMKTGGTVEVDDITVELKLVNEAGVGGTHTVIYGTDDIANYQYNMIENPGPLAEMPNQPAKNFYGGRYNMEVLQEDKIMYRAGNAENPYGRWFTSEPPASVASVRIDTAVKQHWIDPKTGAWEASSYIDNVYAINVPKGTIVYTGPVGPQGGVNMGGYNIMQTYIDAPWNFEVIGKTPLL